ncbi:MAG TPA: fatty acid desaturase CarF family protein [Burkholderiales bacterium]|nr:fatty acid desaturase CarF family protein [Burkholderiales bacterium]
MRALEIAAIALFFALLALSFPGISPGHIPLAALGGWLLADLLSGLVHWALDSFGSVCTPVVGPALIRPFREHHADPAAMTGHGFAEVNGASCLGSLPLLASCFFVDGFPHALLAFTSAGILLTNQCHKWAHAVSPPAFVRLLQKARLVLNAAEHAKHHKPPYDSHFCTANGWLNRPLDWLLK